MTNKNNNPDEIERERRKKISETMKEIYATNLELRKNITETSKRNKEKFGYVNSPEARKKLSDINKRKWANDEVTEKQKSTLFKKGFDPKRNVNQIFKEGHEVPEKTRAAVRKNRATQMFPAKDTSIEIKIQNFLKQLGFEYFTHQYIKEIKHSYQCDILVPSMNLVIECDGNYWHKYPIGTKIDNIRTEELIKKGFKVLRLWEVEINNMTIDKFKEKIGELK